MIVYLLLTAFVLVAAYWVRSDRTAAYGPVVSRQYLYNKIALAAIFLALFLVSALRINVGNDYATYVEFMHRIASGFTNYVPTEAGFNLLTAVIASLYGGRYYLIVFAILAAATVFFFLSGIQRLSEDFALSVALFMLLGYYFQSISTVRYYLALSVALFLIPYVLQKDRLRFVIPVLLAACFHKSMLVVLLLYPLARMRWRKWMYGLFALLCVSTFFLQEQYLQIVVRLYPSYEDTVYLEGGTSLVSIARALIVLIGAGIVFREKLFACEREEAEENLETVALRFYYHANLMALALYVFGSFLPIISRIAYYLSVTQIVFVPFLLHRLTVQDQEQTKRLRRVATIAVLVASALYFAMYMRGAGNDGVRILPYRTFLFHEMPPIMSEKGVH